MAIDSLDSVSNGNLALEALRQTSRQETVAIQLSRSSKLSRPLSRQRPRRSRSKLLMAERAVVLRIPIAVIW